MAYEWLFNDPAPAQPGTLGAMVAPPQPQAPQPQGVGPMISNGLDESLAPGPPKDQADYANRARGWSVLADKFRTDPQYQLALIKFGTSLMQPVAPGQSAAGHVGQSIQGGADFLVQQQQAAAKTKLAERQVNVLERAQTEKEKTGALSREELQQKIDQNAKTYPALIKKLEAEVDRMVSQGKVDEAQAEYYKERARLYPVEVQSDLRRAKAAETAAGKPSSGETTERIFESTVKAMVKSEGISEDEARTRLGAGFLGKASGKAAGVQNLEAMKQEWKIANPRGENESEADYSRRAAQAALDMQTQRKQEDYFTQKMEFINKNGILFKTIEEAEQKFDDFWKKSGRETPGPSQPKGRTEVTMAEVEATAKARNVSKDVIIKALKDRGIKIKP